MPPLAVGMVISTAWVAIAVVFESVELKEGTVSAATVIVKLTVSMSRLVPAVAVLPSLSATVTVTECWPPLTAVDAPTLGEPVIWPLDELIERPAGRPDAL